MIHQRSRMFEGTPRRNLRWRADLLEHNPSLWSNLSKVYNVFLKVEIFSLVLSCTNWRVIWKTRLCPSKCTRASKAGFFFSLDSGKTLMHSKGFTGHQYCVECSLWQGCRFSNKFSIFVSNARTVSDFVSTDWAFFEWRYPNLLWAHGAGRPSMELPNSQDLKLHWRCAEDGTSTKVSATALFEGINS